MVLRCRLESLLLLCIYRHTQNDRIVAFSSLLSLFYYLNVLKYKPINIKLSTNSKPCRVDVLFFQLFPGIVGLLLMCLMRKENVVVRVISVFSPSDLNDYIIFGQFYILDLVFDKEQ